MAVKIAMISLGCNKNLVDAERMLFKIDVGGFEIVKDVNQADVVIVNTCGFIQSAKEEAIETILECAELKKSGVISKIIITGCLAERYREEAAQLFPEADAVIGIGCNSEIAQVIRDVARGKRVVKFDRKEYLDITGGRMLSTLPFYAYLKIAEGCSNACSYCAIPSIRGKFRSVPMAEILKEAQWLADNGVTELIVTAQDTTRYGIDLYREYKLPHLLTELCRIDGIKWIRLLYCYPERITDELIEVIKTEDKIVKYLDIPIQHCDEDVLKAMNRPGNEMMLRKLFEKLRNEIPQITLRTTLITGFPQESVEQFVKLAEFVKDMEFDRLGCFAYSEEDGTPAASFDGQIDAQLRQKRADNIMDMQNLIMRKKHEDKIGSVVEAVVENIDETGQWFCGRTPADAPEIDENVMFKSYRPLKTGEYVMVKITDAIDYDLIGEVVKNESAQ